MTTVPAEPPAPRVPAVREAVPADVPRLAAVLARAFDDDPVARHVFPDDRRRARGLPRFFAIQLRRVFLPGAHVFTTEDLGAAALWQPPGAAKPTLRQTVGLLPLVPTVGSRLAATLRLLAAVESRHPRRPHFYLGVLGTDPDRQGRGWGTAVLSPVLRRCDEAGVPAYLESSKQSNVPFYRRHGFEVTEQLSLPGGPTLWLMWRDPRPPEAADE